MASTSSLERMTEGVRDADGDAPQPRPTDALKRVPTFSGAKALGAKPDLSGERVGTRFIASVVAPDLSGERVGTRFIASASGTSEGWGCRTSCPVYISVV